jgi:hypothetical protein
MTATARDLCVARLVEQLTREGVTAHGIADALRDAFMTGALHGHDMAHATMRAVVRDGLFVDKEERKW